MNKNGKCYYCIYFDELNNGELFCKRYNETIDESTVEENCEYWIGDDINE